MLTMISYALSLGRSPHGERGLKSGCLVRLNHADGSLPSRGAWIEISMASWIGEKVSVAPLTGSVD